jgi:chromosome partitioning protein
VQPFAKLADALAEGPRFDLLVLDPGAGDGRIREIAQSSHFAVIPTTSSTDDLDPTIRLARELSTQGILRRDRIAIALCRTTGSDAASAAARQIIEGEGFTALAGELPTKPTYENAASEGRTLNETAHRSLNDRAETLAQAIMDGLEAIAAQDKSTS